MRQDCSDARPQNYGQHMPVFHLMWINEHNHSKRQNIVIHVRRRPVSGIMRAQPQNSACIGVSEGEGVGAGLLMA